MNIALVRILGDDKYEINTAPRNVGLLYLRDAILKTKSSVRIYHELNELSANILIGKGYRVIGFTIHVMNILETLRVCKYIKEIEPGTHIILGGHHASGSADSLIKLDFIDSVFIGDSERTIVDFINDIKKKEPKEKYIPKSYDELDFLSYPEREIVSKVERIVTSRGCPFSCTFCTTPMMRRLAKEPTYRERSPKNVVDEIEYLVNNGAKRIVFNDDIFCLSSTKSHNRILEIAEGIIKRNITVSYKVQLRVDSITDKDKNLIGRLRESGLREVFLGIESGSENMLDSFKKNVSLEANLTAIKLYDDFGIKVNAGNILATAESTAADVCNSIREFKKMNLAYLLFRRITTKAVVFPGTDLEEELYQKKYIEKKGHFNIASYGFLDEKVGIIVGFLEKHLPYFLSEIGESIFPLRNKALVVHYDEGRKTKVPEILGEWSDKTADFLLSWFELIPLEKISEEAFYQDFQRYMDFVKNIQLNLINHVEDVPHPDFYADTF